jgi:hypothetical protein
VGSSMSHEGFGPQSGVTNVVVRLVALEDSVKESVVRFPSEVATYSFVAEVVIS